MAVSPQPAGAASQPILGERLRVLRRARGASLAAVADATGMSVSFLSLLESGKTDVTISRLLRLGSYYNVPITDLLPSDETRRVVVRAAEGLTSHPQSGVEIRTIRASAEVGIGADVLMLSLGSELTMSPELSGDIFVHVLTGALEVVFAEDDSIVTVAPGDSIFFRIDGTFTCRNSSSQRSKVMVVQTVVG